MFLHMSVSHSVHRGVCIPDCLASGIPACLASLHGVYPSMPCRFPGPRPGGSLRGLARGVSRPTTEGGVEGSDLGALQAHTWGISRPTPEEGVSRPTLGARGLGPQAHTWGCIVMG